MAEEELIKTPAEFGQFVLEKELGHGGMGGVYLGRDKMLDRKVAIKIMLKELGDDPLFVERFQREAQAAAKLNHPNIAQIYSFGQQDGQPYIAMELVSGGSLDKKMEAEPGKLDPIWVMRVGQQLAEGLAMAAESGLVHGDMKPENVLFDSEGNAKIVDFGLAAMHQDSDEIWGTPYYISPEKVRKQKLDYRADMYSLGGTLYHALTGVAPFEGEDAIAVVKARFDGAPKKPSEVRPDLPEGIDEIIMRMLALEPSERHPTYQSLLGDIKRFLDKAGPVATKKNKPRVLIKGKKVRASMAGEMAAPSVDLSTLTGAELPAEGEEEEKKKLSLGAIVGIVIGAVLLVIGLTVGGLVWYVHSSKAAEEEAVQTEIVNKKAQAANAVKGTLEQAKKFGENFNELCGKIREGIDEQTKAMQKLLPKEILKAIGGKVQPPETQDIAEAKKFVEQLYAAPAPESAPAAVAPAATNATTNATNVVVTATNTTNVVAAATNAVAKVEAKKDEKKPEAKEEKKEEKKVEKPAEPEVEIPMPVKQFMELWNDAYYAEAANIRVQACIEKLLKHGEDVSKYGEDTKENVEALAKLSRELLDEFDGIKGMKCVEQTQRKAAILASRAPTLVQNADKLLKKLADRAAKAAKAKAEAEAKEAAAKAEAEEHKKQVDEEIATIQAKVDELMESRIKRMMWESAIKDLQRMKDDLKTLEAKEELRMQQTKFDAYKELHDCFIKKSKGLTFKFKGRIWTVASADANSITFDVMRNVKGKDVKDKPERFMWEKFYTAKQAGLFNKLLTSLVTKGRQTLRTPLLQWSQQMFGAAMTMQLFFGEVGGVAERVPQIVRQAVKEFPDCERYAKKFFPDIKVGEEAEEEEAAAKEAADEKKAKAADKDEAKEEKDDEEETAEEEKDNKKPTKKSGSAKK